MKNLLNFVLTFILTLSGCSANVPNTTTTNKFKVQSKEIINEIDKLSQTRYFIGRPQGSNSKRCIQ